MRHLFPTKIPNNDNKSGEPLLMKQKKISILCTCNHFDNTGLTRWVNVVSKCRSYVIGLDSLSLVADKLSFIVMCNLIMSKLTGGLLPVILYSIINIFICQIWFENWRRHAATYASRSGTPIEIVSKVILRHSNLSTTQRYLGKVSDSEAVRWIENLYG